MIDTPVLRELKHLGKLGLPVVGGQLGMMLLHSVDTLMLGRYGVKELAAASLGTQWIFVTLTIGLGCVMGIDPIVAQRHGRSDGTGAAHALHHGLIIAMFASALISLSWVWTSELLIALGQNRELAEMAQRYVLLQLPSIFAFLGWGALRSYLQGREIVTPAMWVMIPVNLLNILLNWLFIFGPGPFPELGLEGAALSTAASRFFCAGLLVFWIYKYKLHAGAWAPFDLRKRVRYSEISGPLLLGIPTAIQMGLEVAAFALTALVAGQLGQTQLAAHAIVLSVTALLFMMPLGIAVGTTTRVGNLIGAGQSAHLPVTLRSVRLLGGFAILFNMSILIGFRHLIAAGYSIDPTVRNIAAAAFLVAAVFQLSDCTQVIASGVLRGMGRTVSPAVATFIGYYVFGIPFGYYLGVQRGLGLWGLWWGLALGLTAVALALVGWLSMLQNRSLRQVC